MLRANSCIYWGALKHRQGGARSPSQQSGLLSFPQDFVPSLDFVLIWVLLGRTSFILVSCPLSPASCPSSSIHRPPYRELIYLYPFTVLTHPPQRGSSLLASAFDNLINCSFFLVWGSFVFLFPVSSWCQLGVWLHRSHTLHTHYYRCSAYFQFLVWQR